MKKLTSIGLDQKLSKELAEKLNTLLSNYQVFYMNVRGFHWNVQGDKFFELHIKFEELYTDIALKIDEVAERILTLEHTPIHSYSDYLKISKVKEVKNVHDGKKGLEEVLNAFQIIITLQRELLQLSADANDEGTNALMSDYIRAQEKLIWMYSAYLHKK
ncbi:MAG TPA: Dps family protein [Cytophagaceae bacterium]|nr:Dps family protein [Cytophagaceae bacterium]